MLPRFLVYWSQVAPGSPENALWAERCGRLKRIILNPGLIIVWILGLLLGFHLGWPLWLWAKLLVVLGLSGFHGWMIGAARKFAAGERPYAEKTLRLVNEIPSLTTIAIVILVIVKAVLRASVGQGRWPCTHSTGVRGLRPRPPEADLTWRSNAHTPAASGTAPARRRGQECETLLRLRHICRWQRNCRQPGPSRLPIARR